MKNKYILLFTATLLLFSCSKNDGGDSPVEPNYDLTVSSLINTINNFDSVIENGTYSSLNNYFNTPIDNDFLSGTILTSADSYTNFAITGLVKDDASSPSTGTIILNGVGELIVLANQNQKHLIDLKFTLTASSSYESASSYKITSIQQSNIRTVAN